jgi:hypothetical protein
MQQCLLFELKSSQSKRPCPSLHTGQLDAATGATPGAVGQAALLDGRCTPPPSTVKEGTTFPEVGDGPCVSPAGELAGAGQKMVRWVSGGPWARVVDETSGEEYYWHCDSNEVAWSLPEHIHDLEEAARGPGANDVEVAAAVPSGTVGSRDAVTVSIDAAEVRDGAGNLQHLEDEVSAGACRDGESVGTQEGPNGVEDPGPLPAGWLPAKDVTSGDVYFWHKESGAVQWDRPRASLCAGVDPQDDATAAADSLCAGAVSDGREASATVVQQSERVALSRQGEVEGGKNAPGCEASREVVDGRHVQPNEEVAPAVVTAEDSTEAGDATSARSVPYRQQDAAQVMHSGELVQWRALKDEACGDTYYWNVATNETQWMVPEELVNHAEATVANGADMSRVGDVKQQHAVPSAPEGSSERGEAEEALHDAAARPAAGSDSAGAESNPTQEHARASVAVAAALTAAAEGDTLSKLLLTAPRLLLLHAQLQVRRRDLAALQVALWQPPSSISDTSRAHRSAVALICRHIAAEVAELSAQLPAARCEAAAMLSTAPEDGEVLDVPIAQDVAALLSGTVGGEVEPVGCDHEHLGVVPPSRHASPTPHPSNGSAAQACVKGMGEDTSPVHPPLPEEGPVALAEKGEEHLSVAQVIQESVQVRRTLSASLMEWFSNLHRVHLGAATVSSHAHLGWQGG